MSFMEDLVSAFVPTLPRRVSSLPPAYPTINWTKVVDAEIRLKELEIRRIEALAKLAEARAKSRTEGQS